MLGCSWRNRGISTGRSPSNDCVKSVGEIPQTSTGASSHNMDLAQDLVGKLSRAVQRHSCPKRVWWTRVYGSVGKNNAGNYVPLNSIKRRGLFNNESDGSH